MIYKLVAFTSNDCVQGKLFNDHDELICCTIEKPWLNNEPNVSCVPPGTYNLSPVLSPKFGHVYCLENINLDVSLNGDTQRTHILIHAANKASELLGCIAVGRDFSVMGNERAVTSSKDTLRKLMNEFDGLNHVLIIERH